MSPQMWSSLGQFWDFITLDSLALKILVICVFAIYALAGCTWIWLKLSQWHCGRKGHRTEREVVFRGICFREVCTKCGKVVFEGPYDSDPEW